MSITIERTLIGAFLFFLMPLVQAQKLTITIYHKGTLPSDIQTFQHEHVDIHLKDLRELERIEEKLTAPMYSETFNTTNLEGLKISIQNLNKDTLQQLAAAWQTHLAAREVGIHDDRSLPAMVFEAGQGRWLYSGTNLNEGYQQWLAKKLPPASRGADRSK